VFDRGATTGKAKNVLRLPLSNLELKMFYVSREKNTSKDNGQVLAYIRPSAK